MFFLKRDKRNETKKCRSTTTSKYSAQPAYTSALSHSAGRVSRISACNFVPLGSPFKLCLGFERRVCKASCHSTSWNIEKLVLYLQKAPLAGVVYFPASFSPPTNLIPVCSLGPVYMKKVSCSVEGGSFGGYPSYPGGELTFHICNYKTWRTVNMRNKKLARKEGLPS